MIIFKQRDINCEGSKTLYLTFGAAQFFNLSPYILHQNVVKKCANVPKLSGGLQSG